MNWAQIYGDIAKRCKNPKVDVAVVAEVVAALFDLLLVSPFTTALAFFCRGIELAEHRQIERETVQNGQ